MTQPACGAWLRACGIPALSKGTLAGFQEADYCTPLHKPRCKHWFFQRVLWAPFCALLLATAGPSAFAAYPDKPIRLIVPFPAGGAGDFMAPAITLAIAA